MYFPVIIKDNINNMLTNDTEWHDLSYFSSTRTYNATDNKERQCLSNESASAKLITMLLIIKFLGIVQP